MNFVKELCRFRPPQDSRLIIWEVTNFCNLTCEHCCTQSGPHVSRQQDMSLVDYKRIACELDEMNVAEVYFSGGEPFARNDFQDILVAVSEASNVKIFAATNAMMLTRKKLEKLASLNVLRLTISLDGHKPEIHNKLRGSEAAFRKTVEGISLCVEQGVPVRISHMITPDNCHEIEAFCDFVVGLGVKAIALHTILPAGRASEKTENILAQETEQDILARIIKVRKKYEGQVSIDDSIRDSTDQAPIGCPAGERLLHVAANGDISTCSWLYKLDPDGFKIGNLKEQSLQDCLSGWQGSLNHLSNLETECPIPEVKKSTVKAAQ